MIEFLKLSDLMDINELEIALQDGYVRERKHPGGSLVILNYTEKAQFENHWTDVTRQCRGLIIDFPTSNVVARPFAKFLNYAQPGAAEITGPIEVTDKLDGSLGILYPAPDGGWAIATRGSFTSEQALHATDLLRERYSEFLSHVKGGVTRLFEIVYPGNRIVLDYGDLDDLVLLGGVGVRSGNVFGPDVDPHWTGPRADVFGLESLAEAAKHAVTFPRDNAEGFVVRAVDTGAMVKIKQEDYVRLHKIVTGLSERGVWEHMSTQHGDVAGLIADVPDEFHGWLREVADGLMDQFETLQGRAHHAYNQIPEVETRREYAEHARQYGDLTPLLFLLLDGRELDGAIWKRIRPVGHRPMTHRTEDVA